MPIVSVKRQSADGWDDGASCIYVQLAHAHGGPAAGCWLVGRRADGSGSGPGVMLVEPRVMSVYESTGTGTGTGPGTGTGTPR